MPSRKSVVSRLWPGCPGEAGERGLCPPGNQLVLITRNQEEKIK